MDWEWYELQNNADGSKTVWFGEIELRFMREWSSKRAALLQKGIA